MSKPKGISSFIILLGWKSSSKLTWHVQDFLGEGFVISLLELLRLHLQLWGLLQLQLSEDLRRLLAI